MNELFFELIRIAIGTQETLSRQPSKREWGELYKMAKKQSLVGICFAGVQKTLTISPLKGEDPTVIGMPEMLYLRWMGMAAKIQQKNDTVNRQCAELQQMLAGDGLRSCILKGQRNASLYPKDLQRLRQSGDIDVWVDGPKEKVVEWASAHGGKELTGDLHVECKVFSDTTVEVHFTPSIASSPKVNRKLQEWFEEQKHSCFLTQNHGMDTPLTFNLVYLLHHIFRHYLYEGVGLRQVMDYYFILRSAYENENSNENLMKTLSSLGLIKFAGALMWVITNVFDPIVNNTLDPTKSLTQVLAIEPDEKRGRRLLEVIMEGGNFGHGTKKYKVTGWDKPWTRLSRYVRRNWFMLQDYPDEILWNLIKKFRRLHQLISFLV